MPFALNGTTRLFWRTDGLEDRPVVLLLNSIGTDVSLWDPALPHLLGHFRLLRMDTRGHGASDAPPGDYTLALLAADAFAVMDAAGVEHAAVCGVSLGGMIAMTMALDAPHRVSALVPACTSASMDRETWAARTMKVRSEGTASIADMALQRFFAPGFREQHPELVATVRDGLITTAAEGYAGCCAAIRDMRLLDRLPAIEAPCLLVAGTKDVSTPLEGHGSLIAAAIRGTRIESLNTAHLACLEDPSGFARALVAFLSRPADDDDVMHARKRLYDAGLKIRRVVLGDDWVDRSIANVTPFNADFQAMITRIAWQEIWTRPGLDHRTRRLLVLAITAALGRWEEFRLHVKAGLEQDGFSIDELKETLMQTAIYAGVPAANTGFAEAAAVLRENAASTKA